jgi:hypothetical protein
MHGAIARVAQSDVQAVMAERPRSGAGRLEGRMVRKRARQMVFAYAERGINKCNGDRNKLGPRLGGNMANAMTVPGKAPVAIGRRCGLLDSERTRGNRSDGPAIINKAGQVVHRREQQSNSEDQGQ